MSPASVGSANRLLAALPDDERRRLLAGLKPAPMAFRHVFHRRGDRIQSVCFPSGGVASVLSTMADGRTVEVASVGREGLIGLTPFFGGEEALADVLVVVPGEPAQGMPVADFRRELERRGPFYDVVSRYVQAFVALAIQASACNSLHSVEQRCCRWLLLAQDRVQANALEVTHDSLAVTLGVRRPTVSLVVGELERASVIAHGRGRIGVLDRDGLESASCECYRIMRALIDRLP